MIYKEGDKMANILISKKQYARLLKVEGGISDE